MALPPPAGHSAALAGTCQWYSGCHWQPEGSTSATGSAAVPVPLAAPRTAMIQLERATGSEHGPDNVSSVHAGTYSLPSGRAQRPARDLGMAGRGLRAPADTVAMADGSLHCRPSLTRTVSGLDRALVARFATQAGSATGILTEAQPPQPLAGNLNPCQWQPQTHSVTLPTTSMSRLAHSKQRS